MLGIFDTMHVQFFSDVLSDQIYLEALVQFNMERGFFYTKYQQVQRY